MFPLLQFLFYLVCHYILYVVMYNQLKPAFIPDDVVRKKKLGEVPCKMIHLGHAILTSLTGIGYLVSLVSEERLHAVRVSSCAFLLFDMVQGSILWNKQSTDDLTNPSHPFGLALHHSLTFSFMFGIMFGGTNAGLIAFFCGELPVVTLSLTWLFRYHGNGDSPWCDFLHLSSLVLYFITRIVGFPLMFLFFMLPKMDTNVAFAFVTVPVCIAMYLMVYAMNCMWFIKLLNFDNQKHKRQSVV